MIDATLSTDASVSFSPFQVVLGLDLAVCHQAMGKLTPADVRAFFTDNEVKTDRCVSARVFVQGTFHLSVLVRVDV